MHPSFSRIRFSLFKQTTFVTTLFPQTFVVHQFLYFKQIEHSRWKREYSCLCVYIYIHYIKLPVYYACILLYLCSLVLSFLAAERLHKVCQPTFCMYAYTPTLFYNAYFTAAVAHLHFQFCKIFFLPVIRWAHK